MRKKGVADPSITKRVNPGSGYIGDVLVFTITVRNQGTLVADNVVVQDTLPDYLDILGVKATRGEVSIEGQTVLVNIGTVAPGDVITIDITTRINDRVNVPVGYNTARISTTSTTDDPGNNTDTAIFTILWPNTTPLPIPPELPRTGTPAIADERHALTLLGMLLLLLGLALRRALRSSRVR